MVTLTLRSACSLLLGLVCALLVLPPLPAHAANLPGKPGLAAFKKHSSSGGSALAALSTEQIDAIISRIQARENELRTHPLPEGIDLIADVPNGATAEEYREWRRLTRQLINLLDGRIQSLRFLKDIRQSVKDLETQRKGWRGLSEKPPYPLSLLDSLQDRIQARQFEIRSNDMRLTISEGELAEFTSGLRETGTQQRLAEERLEKSIGKPEEARLRWLLALAARRNELNETGAVSTEAARQMLQESLAWLRQEVVFLDQKFAQAASNFRFSGEELETKLKGLDARRDQLRLALEDAVKAEEIERTSQEKIRSSLERYKERTATTTVTPQLEALRQDLETQQVRVETASLKALIYKMMSRLVTMERGVWQSRFQFANPGKDPVPPDMEQLKRNQDTLANWKEYLRSRMDGVDNHIRSQDTRIASPDLSDRERGNARVLLAAHREQKTLMSGVDEQISGTEQLLQRFAGEVSARSTQGGRVAGRLSNLLAITLSGAGKIWNFDLYVAEETVIVDGQKIVKSRSVTIGKVIQALLIFFVGIYAARKGMGPVRRHAARKFNLNENDAQVFGRVTYYVLFIAIVVFALSTVNIPLAVFAFMGGALAIGIGFGAQTLIGNFISGLILLFDRTISLNDVVEVDGHRGRVTAIKIRSSRIKRFDGIEVLVPNSHFLQQNVVNLTLSDPYTRFEITVGVAYGTPTRTAEETIFRAVTEQPEVRKDPPPYVVFEDFADSALNFRAFFWIDLDPAINSNIVRSEIRHRIGEYLAQAEISIPFPQRDLHLDAARPLEVVIREERETAPVD